MATRAQVLIPIGIAAVIIGVVGMLSLPKDIKLEQTEFPQGLVKIDDVIQNSGLRHLIRPNVIKKSNQKSGDTDRIKEFRGGILVAQSIKAPDKIKQNSYEYIFLDESLSFQDNESVERIILCLKELKNKNKTIFLVTHLKEIVNFADDIIEVTNGKVLLRSMKPRE